MTRSNQCLLMGYLPHVKVNFDKITKWLNNYNLDWWMWIGGENIQGQRYARIIVENKGNIKLEDLDFGLREEAFSRKSFKLKDIIKSLEDQGVEYATKLPKITPSCKQKCFNFDMSP